MPQPAESTVVDVQTVDGPKNAAPKRKFGPDFPYLLSEWKEILNPKTMMADVWAGVTVALVALPLNLALAIAAGVEPGVGITTGIIAGIVAAFLGGQKYGVTGPAAAMAVVLIGIAQAYGIAAIWLVGLLAGALQVAAGWFRMGKLISFIPMPVIVGFANAIGILVIANSLSDFLGLKKEVAHVGSGGSGAGYKFIPEFLQDIGLLFYRVIMHHEVNTFALATGLIVLLLAWLVPKWTRVVPGPLVAIVVASVVAALCGFQIPRIIDISTVPSSLPMPRIPELPWQDFEVLFPAAITVFMLGSIESLLSASVADGMTMSKRHHSDQELIGQGIANLVSPFFGGIPVTGVIARTAVNIRAGAKTRLAAMVHCVVLLLLVLVMARYAEQIPLAALAGVLIFTGCRLVEWDATKQIWHASRTEGYVVLVTTAVSVLIDLTAGVFTGLLMTCALFIRQMSASVVVPEADPTDRRSRVRQPIASCKFVRTFLVDGPLFFGAAERFTETILETQKLKAVVLHMKAVSIMDLTGVETIFSIHAQLQRNGIRLCLTEVPDQPFSLLKRAGALKKIGEENFFKDYKKCLIDVNARLLETSCGDCKLAMSAAPGSKVAGPTDCNLRSALLLNTNQVASLIKERIDSEGVVKAPRVAPVQLDISRLIAVRSDEDIPNCIRETPVYSLIKAQNLMEVDEAAGTRADLIVGMCIDYRKQLHMPKNAAYVIRSPGANMKDSEFALALAVSSGIECMALITHNYCLMSDPFANEQGCIDALGARHGWKEADARTFFDEHATAKAIRDPVQFALKESERLTTVFSGLKVIPLLYSLDDDKLYLMKKWVDAQTAAEATTAGVIAPAEVAPQL